MDPFIFALPTGFYDDRMYASRFGAVNAEICRLGAATFLDFDNDGDLDIFIANGDAFNLDGAESLLLENQGKAKFTDASGKGGALSSKLGLTDEAMRFWISITMGGSMSW